LVQVSKVIDLQQWSESDADASPAMAAEALRDELTESLDQERSVVTGPRVKKAAALKREILEDEDFVRTVRAIALAENKDPDAMLIEARKNFDAIAADFSLLMTKFLAVVLTPVFQLIYDGLEVDEEGLEKVREAARDGRIV